MATAKPYHIYPGEYLRSRKIKPIPENVTLTDSGFATVAYPNRDSTPYKERYNIPEAQTIIRYNSKPTIEWLYGD